MLRNTSTIVIIIISLCCFILEVNLENIVFKEGNKRYDISMESNPSLFLPFLAIIQLAFVFLWAIYIYWAEKQKKLDFWGGNKKIKEFNKLKSILNLMMPDFVRERIRQGDKQIADDEGEVTIIFCDIYDFDMIVDMYTGKELCELLDHIYNALDQLCE